jgi:uncharacterized protein (TIGR00251 family)
MKIIESANGVSIDVRVHPGAKKNKIIGEQAAALKIALTAPPVDGKANQALIKFMSEFLNVNRSKVSIIRGEKSRSKTVFIQDFNAATLTKLLSTITS